jgi:hypothetical protein
MTTESQNTPKESVQDSEAEKRNKTFDGKKIDPFSEEGNMRAWDRIVQQAIEGELVGKAGYKPHRLSPQDPVVNITHLPQSRVRRTAVVACKAVRTYRQALLAQFKIDYEALAKQAIAQEEILAGAGMLDFAKKKEAEKLLFQIKVQIATLDAIEKSLKNVNPAILTQSVPVDHPAAQTKKMIITPEEAKSL